MTLEECVQEVAARLAASDSFFGHGTDNPRDEAAWLVMHVAKSDNPATAMQPGQLEELEILIDRRIRDRVPIAYLLGYAWFCGLKFQLSPDVLVPRSPIAELIQAGFQPWLHPEEPLRALDLCTGSGCIAVAMAHYWPHWRVDAADLSAAAVAQAEANCKVHEVSAKVRVFEGDLFAACSAHDYDLIVTNPPYVGRSEYAILPAEYRTEPMLGLVAGEDGLDIVYRILSQAAEFLSERGILVCEVGHSQAALVQQMPDAPFMWFDFEHGGQGVFMLDRQQLVDLSGVLQQILRERADVQ
jgi:ribosomal protein L3 glutamine methyltransferase